VTVDGHYYEWLACALAYPTADTLPGLEAHLPALRAAYPRAARGLDGLRAYLGDHPVEDAQELYTRTFDINPVCSLDVGFHLFGEDYDRGRFLAMLRGSQQEAGMPEERELPDHLPVVLRWLARVYGSELHVDMVTECVLPALRKMDEALGKGTNPYAGLLQTIAAILEADLRQVSEASPSPAAAGCASVPS
jgi:nitrate reductase delta subunit